MEASRRFAAQIQTKIYTAVGRNRSLGVAVRRAWTKFYESNLLQVIEVFTDIFDLLSHQIASSHSDCRSFSATISRQSGEVGAWGG